MLGRAPGLETPTSECMANYEFLFDSITCVIRCTTDATDHTIDAADRLILQHILNDGNYDISADDRTALESVCATLMPTSDLEK